MCATLEAENAYNIFKGLNSTGVPLGPADLIRNFVFMHIPPDGQDEFDRELWGPLEDRFARADGTLDEDRFSRFFRDYLMSQPEIGYVPPKETFPRFEAEYAATDFSPRELAGALTVSAQHYAIISGQEADESVPVTQALAGLNQLESSTTYPLLLALFARRASGAINAEQLAHAINMLCGFILRRFICGDSSRGYGRMFVRAVGKEGDDPFKMLEPYLLERGWPDDRRFEAAFVEFPLFQRGYAREVLVALERARGHKEPADLKDTAGRAHSAPDAQRCMAGGAGTRRRAHPCRLAAPTGQPDTEPRTALNCVTTRSRRMRKICGQQHRTYQGTSELRALDRSRDSGEGPPTRKRSCPHLDRTEGTGTGYQTWPGC